MVSGSALDDAWTKQLPKGRMCIVVVEGVFQYFTKGETAQCLCMLCDSFDHGFLLAEMNSPKLAKYTDHHDTVKNTNAKFKWGTDSGQAFVALEPRLHLESETSFNAEMSKYTLRGKLFAATVGKNLNNRLAVFSW
jgi:O-methyltransferase involved in polyketide biosynthesis